VSEDANVVTTANVEIALLPLLAKLALTAIALVHQELVGVERDVSVADPLPNTL
jgi:hypothetical protein